MSQLATAPIAPRTDTPRQINVPTPVADPSPTNGHPHSPPVPGKTPHEAPKKSRRWLVLGIVGAVAVVGLAFFIPAYLHSLAWQNTDDAFIDAQVVSVAPKVGGYVQALLVTDNQHVKAGDKLVQIDPRDLEATLHAAQAELKSDQAKLQQTIKNADVLKANVDAAQADVKAAQANAENAKTQAERFRAISEEAASPQERTTAFAAEKSAAAAVVSAQGRVDAAQAQLEANDATVHSAEAQVGISQAKVATAELDLSHTWILAPVDGKVTRRSVEKGDYLQPGQQLLAIVPDEVWVTANFKETQLNSIRPGQQAIIRIDAYGGREFKGHVDSIQSGTGARFSLLPPENATGNYVKVVQRVPVKIVFDEKLPDDLTIAPGMSVEPEVKVK